MTRTKYRLSEVLTIKNGKDYKHLQEGEIPVFGSGGYMCSVDSFLYDKPSVLLPRKGTLANIQYFDKGKFWTVDTCFYSIVKKEVANPYYIYRYLKTLDLSGYDTGASIPSMTQKTYNSIKVFLPPLVTQHKVASVLAAYDSLIDNNQKRIKLLEQMAENLYKEWFVRFRFPGYENVEFEEGKPKGWCLERLGDFGIVLETGSRPKGGIDSSIDDGIPSLGAEAINGLAEFDYNNLKLVPQDHYDKMKKGKNKGNHILLYKDGAYIGKVTIFRNDFPFKIYSINEHVFFLNTKDEAYQNYLYFTLHQPSLFSLMQNLNRNAAQPGLSQQDIYRIKVMKPTKDVVCAFNSFIEPIFNEVFNLAKEIHLLSHQRDLLLPRLMSGKLSI